LVDFNEKYGKMWLIYSLKSPEKLKRLARFVLAMELLNQEERRAAVGKYMLQNPGSSKYEVFQHFHAMGLPKTTFYRIVKRLEATGETARIPGSGRKTSKVTPRLEHRIVKAAKHKKGVSSRKLGSKFGLSHWTIQKTLKDNHVKYFKKKTVPDYSQDQAQRAKTAAHKLRRDFFNFTQFYVTQIYLIVHKFALSRISGPH